MDKLLKSASACFMSTIGLFLALSYQFYIAAFTLIVFDYATGLYKAGYTQSVNSAVARKGLWKKLGLLMAITFGWILQILQMKLINPQLGVSWNIPIGAFVSCYIIIMEIISISENLETCGVLPPFVSKIVRKYLEIFNKKVEKAMDSMDEVDTGEVSEDVSEQRKAG